MIPLCSGLTEFFFSNLHISLSNYCISITMRKILIISISILLLCCCKPKMLATTTKVENNTLEAEVANIQRIVCFKFKPGTSPEALQQHMKGFQGLKDSISYNSFYVFRIVHRIIKSNSSAPVVKYKNDVF